MSAVVYEWADGARAPAGLSAQTAGEYLAALEADYGSLTATVVLEAASDPDSPIHVAFEWDDTEAAREYRLEQARRLVRCVTVKRVEEQETPQVRAFVHLRTPNAPEQASYVSATTAAQDPFMRRQMLDRALDEVESWRRKYADLQEFARIHSEIDKAKGARLPRTPRRRKRSA